MYGELVWQANKSSSFRSPCVKLLKHNRWQRSLHCTKTLFGKATTPEVKLTKIKFCILKPARCGTSIRIKFWSRSIDNRPGLNINQLSWTVLPEPWLEVFQVAQHLVGADFGNERQDLVGLGRRRDVFGFRFAASRRLDDDRSRWVDISDSSRRNRALTRITRLR